MTTRGSSTARPTTSRISLCERRSHATLTTRSGRRAKTEQVLASAGHLPSSRGSNHDSAHPPGEKLHRVRARRDHRDRAVFPLSLPRREFLLGTHLPLGAAGIPGLEVFLHLVSIYDALHRLFDPSLWDLHLHLEDSSAAKSGKATGISKDVQSQQFIPRTRRGPQPTSAGALGNTLLAHDSRTWFIHRDRRLRGRWQWKDKCGSLPEAGDTRMTAEEKENKKSISSAEDIRTTFHSSDRLAVLIRNRSRGETIQRITTSARIVEPAFQEWMHFKNEKESCDIYVGMNSLKPEARTRA